MSSKNRVRSPYCTNCGKVLQEPDNYCPNCGQENDNKRQSFSKVMSHLVLDFLHIDSKIAKSIPALIFRPAFLTKEYLRGKRQLYLDPVKMFITIVVVYFILVSLTSHKTLPDNTKINIDTISVNTDTSVIFDQGPFKIKLNDGSETETLLDSNGNINNNLVSDDPEYQKLKDMVQRGKTDTREVMDSLKVEPTMWNRFYFSQAIKFIQMDFYDFKKFLISKFPWIIFCLIPIFALLLKLLNIRKDFLYIDHLIFAFHLHAFFFLTGICYLLVSLISGYEISNWLLILILIYIFMAFRNFYMQSWLITFLKIFSMAVLYIFTAMFCFVLSLMVIFVIY